jgi:hypothetical protein
MNVAIRVDDSNICPGISLRRASGHIEACAEAWKHPEWPISNLGSLVSQIQIAIRILASCRQISESPSGPCRVRCIGGPQHPAPGRDRETLVLHTSLRLCSICQCRRGTLNRLRTLTQLGPPSAKRPPGLRSWSPTCRSSLFGD